jgi:hypothetical protein
MARCPIGRHETRSKLAKQAYPYPGSNIDHLKALLKTETDPTKRAMEERILADEEAKLASLPKDIKKAF